MKEKPNNPNIKKPALHPASDRNKASPSYQSLEIYRGLLPHPRHLKEFEDICPGSADRIIRVFEKQADHRHLLESQHLKEGNRNARWGIIAQTTQGIAALAATAISALYTPPYVPIALFTLGLVYFAFIYCYGKKLQVDERRRQREAEINMMSGGKQNRP